MLFCRIMSTRERNVAPPDGGDRQSLPISSSPHDLAKINPACAPSLHTRPPRRATPTPNPSTAVNSPHPPRGLPEPPPWKSTIPSRRHWARTGDRPHLSGCLPRSQRSRKSLRSHQRESHLASRPAAAYRLPSRRRGNRPTPGSLEADRPPRSPAPTGPTPGSASGSMAIDSADPTPEASAAATLAAVANSVSAGAAAPVPSPVPAIPNPLPPGYNKVSPSSGFPRPVRPAFDTKNPSFRTSRFAQIAAHRYVGLLLLELRGTSRTRRHSVTRGKD